MRHRTDSSSEASPSESVRRQVSEMLGRRYTRRMMLEDLHELGCLASASMLDDAARTGRSSPALVSWSLRLLGFVEATGCRPSEKPSPPELPKRF